MKEDIKMLLLYDNVPIIRIKKIDRLVPEGVKRLFFMRNM